MVSTRWIGLALGLCLTARAAGAHAKKRHLEYTYDRGGRIAKPKPPPTLLKATPGQRPPEGYRVEKRPRTGFVIAGTIVTMGGSLVTVYAATSEYKELYLSAGMMLGTGLGLLGVGLFSEKTVWVRRDARLELTPVIGLGHAGGSARLTF